MKDQQKKLHECSQQPQQLHIPFTNNLYYKYEGLSANEQIFLINGKKHPYKHHPFSLKDKGKKLARPRVQLNEEHARAMAFPMLDERSSDVTKVVFPNGRVNYVLFCRRHSACTKMRKLHECMEQRGMELDVFLSTLESKCLLKDELGGGWYIASGYGNMGRNVSPALRRPDQPALRKCLRHSEHHVLAKIVGTIFSYVAGCISAHCPKIYETNQKLLKKHPKLAWPPLKYQGQGCKWMSTQFAVRRWGPAHTEAERFPERETVAAHTDRGDLDCFTCHIYRTGGGWRVAGTDIAVFEHSEGGPGYRVKTCVEDAVVLLLFQSHSQLHGCIKSADDYIEDSTAWSTRIIPYIPRGVYHWMTRNPNGDPFIDIP